MRLFLLACTALVLTSCATTRENAIRANNDVRYASYDSYKRIRGYMAWKHAPQPIVEQETSASYCYQKQSDIMCYAEPIPGADNTLVGYQEPIMTRTLVRQEAVGAKTDADMPIFPRHVAVEKTHTFPGFVVQASNDPIPRTSNTIIPAGKSVTTVTTTSTTSSQYVGSAPSVASIDEASSSKPVIGGTKAPAKSKPANSSTVQSGSSSYGPKDAMPTF